jgi:MFS family permease
MADSKPQTAAPLPILLIVSCSATWVVAQLSYNALPQLLDPIKVAFDRSDEVVTRMYGYELFVFAIVALAAAGPLARFSRVFVALVGGAVAVAAGVVSALTDSYSVLVVSRIMLGAGGALVGAAGTAAAASSREPERVYAVVMIVSQVVLAFEPALLERLALGPFGLDGGFYGLAAATALLMPLFIWLLPPRRSESVATTSAWAAILQAPNRAIAVATMLALFILETGQGGIWTYLAQLGQHSGVDDRLYGDSMAVIQLVALSGSFLAVWIDKSHPFRDIEHHLDWELLLYCPLSIGPDGQTRRPWALGGGRRRYVVVGGCGRPPDSGYDRRAQQLRDAGRISTVYRRHLHFDFHESAASIWRQAEAFCALRSTWVKKGELSEDRNQAREVGKGIAATNRGYCHENFVPSLIR